jgi:hypothetical protein
MKKRPYKKLKLGKLRAVLFADNLSQGGLLPRLAAT